MSPRFVSVFLLYNNLSNTRCILFIIEVRATQVISLIVKNEFGVMQRVMGEFTRNKINVETIVVGKCEQVGKSRMVLSVIDKDQATLAVGRLEKLQDVFDARLVEESGQSAYALISTTGGNVGVVGVSSQVDEIIERSRPERFVKALNAL